MARQASLVSRLRGKSRLSLPMQPGYEANIGLVLRGQRLNVLSESKEDFLNSRGKSELYPRREINLCCQCSWNLEPHSPALNFVIWSNISAQHFHDLLNPIYVVCPRMPLLGVNQNHCFGMIMERQDDLRTSHNVDSLGVATIGTNTHSLFVMSYPSTHQY